MKNEKKLIIIKLKNFKNSNSTKNSNHFLNL